MHAVGRRARDRARPGRSAPRRRAAVPARAAAPRLPARSPHRPRRAAGYAARDDARPEPVSRRSPPLRGAPRTDGGRTGAPAAGEREAAADGAPRRRAAAPPRPPHTGSASGRSADRAPADNTSDRRTRSGPAAPWCRADAHLAGHPHPTTAATGNAGRQAPPRPTRASLAGLLVAAAIGFGVGWLLFDDDGGSCLAPVGPTVDVPERDEATTRRPRRSRLPRFATRNTTRVGGAGPDRHRGGGGARLLPSRGRRPRPPEAAARPSRLLAGRDGRHPATPPRSRRRAAVRRRRGSRGDRRRAPGLRRPASSETRVPRCSPSAASPRPRASRP